MVRPGGWFGHEESIVEQVVRRPRQDAVWMQQTINEQEVQRPKQDAVQIQLINLRAQAVFGWEEAQEPRVDRIASSQTRRPSRQRGMVQIDAWKLAKIVSACKDCERRNPDRSLQTAG